MCGIGAIIKKEQSYTKLVDDILKIASTLHHRGPDDEGYLFVQPNNQVVRCFGSYSKSSSISQHNLLPLSEVNSPIAAFSHKRLSILDTSFLGHQPMACPDNRYYIIHNGEIYNFHELREELRSLGFTFNSTSDTEVLLAAFKAWGKAMLTKLNGMWAFAIYDMVNQSVFIARDRFGVKPLYYINHDKAFAFASEIKALTQVSLTDKLSINKEVVREYLVNATYEPTGETFFNEINELKAGHWMEYNLKTHDFIIHNYYTLETNQKWEKHDEGKFKQYVQGVEERVIDAINLRLRSDVKVGACLSGGIDSSVLVSYVQKKQQIETFTSAYKGEGEQWYASEVMKGNEKYWNQSYPQAVDFFHSLEELVYVQDQPFYGTSTFAQFDLMKQIHNKGIKVTLDGQGADELFGGYSRHYFELIREAFSFRDLSKASELLLSSSNKFASKAQFIKELVKRNVDVKTLHPYASYLSNDLYLGIEKPSFPKSSLNNLLVQDFTGNVLKGIFRTADRNAMRFSVESRMPFADDINLIEYVFSIPSSYKICGSTNKVLLREAFKNLLPATIYNRKDKVGFYTPEVSWIQHMNDEWLHYLTPDLAEYINVAALRKDWKVIMDNPKMNSTWVWRILNFAIWKKMFGL